MGGPLGDLEPYQQALDEAFECHGVVLAYLYGSQARGDTGPLSDVDVAVLFGPNVPESERFNQLPHLTGELGSVFRRNDVYVVDLAGALPLLPIVSTTTTGCSTAPTMQSACVSRRQRCGTMWIRSRCVKSSASTLYNTSGSRSEGGADPQ